jgi:phage-related protein
MGWTIKYYTDSYGTCSVRDFIDSISPEARAKFIFIADLLEEYGIGVKEPYVKSISGQKKLFEIRIKDRVNIHRIFYFTESSISRIVAKHWFCFTASQKRQRKPLKERLGLP